MSRTVIPGAAAKSAQPALPLKYLVMLFATLLALGLVLHPGAARADVVSDLVEVDFEPVKGKWKKQRYEATVKVTNLSNLELHSPLRIVILDFKNKRHLLGEPAGYTDDGLPYIEVDLPGGVLGVGVSTDPMPVVFEKMSNKVWKKWKKKNRNLLEAASKEDNGNPVDANGWSEHDFPIKFRYLVNAAATPFVLSVSTPDAAPGAVRLGSGVVDVRFTVSILSNLDQGIGQVVLRNQALEIAAPMNDDGENGDLDPNDGVFTTIRRINTDDFESEHCFPFFATAETDANGQVVSDDYLFCMTRLPPELAEPNTDDNNIVELDGARVLGDEILVRLTPGTPTAAFDKYLTTIYGMVAGSQLEDGLLQVRFDGRFTPEYLAELIKQISAFDGVEAVEPNYVGSYTAIPSDVEFPGQHALQLVSADSLAGGVPRYVWEAGATGANRDGAQAVVVLLDSGVRPDHPDDLDPLGEFGKDTNDQVGHGTQMAGIIAVETENATGVAAMARDAKLRSVRISKNANISLSEMLDGFKRAKGYAGRNKVISASFSINNMLSDGGVCRKINQIINRGAVVVVSAGNDNDDSSTGIVPGNCKSDDFDIFTYPGPVSADNKASLIVVGASSCADGDCASDERWVESPDVGSNFGDWVDISAPGVGVTTTTLDGSYAAIDGTSASTALVAGGVAILRACDVGGTLTSSDGVSSTLGLNLADVLNTLDLGALTPVTGLPNRMNVYHALASVNTPPLAIGLSNDSINDGTDTTGGFELAQIGITDDTVCDAHTIEVTGVGDDAASFSIGGDLGDRLIIDDGVVDFRSKPSYQVELTVTDFYGLPVSQVFTIVVIDP